jgi:glycosyltransferase involved in cell wall biosynthesis
MRVLHVSPTDIEGGAAKGAYNLHTALRAADIDSLMLVNRKYGDDPSVLTSGKTDGVMYEGLRDRLDRLPLRFYSWNRQSWWTVGWLPFDLTETIDGIKPDVVHFHWSGRGAAPIKMMERLKHYPIVWTLRDIWPLTGGCHYTVGCEKLYTGCGACPQIGSHLAHDISSWTWRRKHRAWRNADISFVAMSKWMAECARKSPLTFDNEITVIPNGIDTQRFAPLDKVLARKLWGLSDDRKIIMFGAINSTKDPRKGYSYLCEALRILGDQGWRERAEVVVFGAATGATDLGLDVRYVGKLNDTVSLSTLYSCADVMVVPSTEENFAKTPIEAMACGVPVAAFANTGQLDIIDHKVNGYLAENLSSEDLARGIAWCLEAGAETPALSRRARAKAVDCFDIHTVAQRYADHYELLLQRRQQPALVAGTSPRPSIAERVPSSLKEAAATTRSIPTL